MVLPETSLPGTRDDQEGIIDSDMVVKSLPQKATAQQKESRVMSVKSCPTCREPEKAMEIPAAEARGCA